MSDSTAHPQVVAAEGDGLWFLGTYTRVKLDAAQTGGRLGAFETVFPHGAAPPLHSHPEDETFYVLEGEVTAWVVPPEATGGDWVAEFARPLGAGAMVYAPGGTPHSFRVESGTARMLILSTPAGIEDYVRSLAEPARWPWLQPPPDGPRVAPEQIAASEEQRGVIRHGPPPPAA